MSAATASRTQQTVASLLLETRQPLPADLLRALTAVATADGYSTNLRQRLLRRPELPADAVAALAVDARWEVTLTAFARTGVSTPNLVTAAVEQAVNESRGKYTSVAVRQLLDEPLATPAMKAALGRSRNATIVAQYALRVAADSERAAALDHLDALVRGKDRLSDAISAPAGRALARLLVNDPDTGRAQVRRMRSIPLLLALTNDGEGVEKVNAALEAIDLPTFAHLLATAIVPRLTAGRVTDKDRRAIEELLRRCVGLLDENSLRALLPLTGGSTMGERYVREALDTYDPPPIAAVEALTLFDASNGRAAATGTLLRDVLGNAAATIGWPAVLRLTGTLGDHPTVGELLSLVEGVAVPVDGAA